MNKKKVLVIVIGNFAFEAIPVIIFLSLFGFMMVLPFMLGECSNKFLLKHDPACRVEREMLNKK